MWSQYQKRCLCSREQLKRPPFIVHWSLKSLGKHSVRSWPFCPAYLTEYIMLCDCLPCWIFSCVFDRRYHRRRKPLRNDEARTSPSVMSLQRSVTSFGIEGKRRWLPHLAPRNTPASAESVRIRGVTGRDGEFVRKESRRIKLPASWQRAMLSLALTVDCIKELDVNYKAEQ